MNNDKTKEFLDLFNTGKEFSEDLIAYKKCKDILNNYVRSEAIMHTQALIKRYSSEINQIGLLNGVYVVSGLDYSALSDSQIEEQLIYIGQKIIVYALFREGKKDASKAFLNRIDILGFDAYK